MKRVMYFLFGLAGLGGLAFLGSKGVRINLIRNITNIMVIEGIRAKKPVDPAHARRLLSKMPNAILRVFFRWVVAFHQRNEANMHALVPQMKALVAPYIKADSEWMYYENVVLPG